MSTNDVPGMNPDNRDSLHAGCWAEHADGTLLYVLGTENHRVIFELYDMSDAAAPVEFRDAMPQREFEKKFSYDPKDPKSVKWTWHDKSVFPWNRILGKFKPGVKPVSADAAISEAAKIDAVRSKRTGKRKRVHPATVSGRVSGRKKNTANAPATVARRLAAERSLNPTVVEHADVEHRVEREVPKGSIAKRVRDRIQGAISKLRPGKGESDG